MRNRAKCKLCNEILESLVHNDIVECKCGEICIAGGSQALHAWAKDWNNFLRVDDDNREIPVKYVDAKKEDKRIDFQPIYKDKCIEALHHLKESLQSLPPNAMTQPITHYDLLSLVSLLSDIFRCET